jgi:hypothetical protein
MSAKNWRRLRPRYLLFHNIVVGHPFTTSWSVPGGLCQKESQGCALVIGAAASVCAGRDQATRAQKRRTLLFGLGRCRVHPTRRRNKRSGGDWRHHQRTVRRGPVQALCVPRKGIDAPPPLLHNGGGATRHQMCVKSGRMHESPLAQTVCKRTHAG